MEGVDKMNTRSFICCKAVSSGIVFSSLHCAIALAALLSITAPSCLPAGQSLHGSEMTMSEVGFGDTRIHVLASLNRPSVKNGETLIISVLVKSIAPIDKVEADLGGVARVDLQPRPGTGNIAAEGSHIAVYEAQWRATGLEEKVYDVAITVRDVTGHTLVDRSLRFSDPAAGNSTPGSTNYPNAGMTRLGKATFDITESLVTCMVVDSVNGYAYCGTYTAPGRVIKIKLGNGNDPPVRIGGIMLNTGEDYLTRAVIDETSGYAYFGTLTSPAKLVKVKLGAGDTLPTRIGVVTLNSGENNVGAAVIDPNNGYAYLGTYDFPPGRVVKVALGSGDNPPTRVGVAVLLATEYALNCGGIDVANGYAYFGTVTNPGIVVKVALGAGSNPPSRVGAVTLNSGENWLRSAVVDAAGGYGYFGTDTNPGRVVKVALGAGTNPPSRVGAVTLNSGEGPLTGAALYSGGGYADFVTSTTPGRIVKIALGSGSNPPTRLGALTLSAGEGPLWAADFDPNNRIVYAAAGSVPGQLLKVAHTQMGFIKTTSLTLSETADVYQMHFYSHSSTGEVRLALYNNASPRQLLWQSSSLVNSVANGFLSVPISAGSPSALTLTPGTYHLAWQTNTPESVPSYSAGAANSGSWVSYAYDTFPSDIPSTSYTLTNENWTHYFTYYVSGELEVESVQVQTSQSVDVIFNRPLDPSSAFEPTNYTISGSGRGTLATYPSTVQQIDDLTYRLIWNTGSQTYGGDVTITVTGVSDFQGLPIGTNNSATHVGGGLPVIMSHFDIE